jgi:hypothetical protein
MSGRVVVENAIIKCSCGAVPTPLLLNLCRNLQISGKTVCIITDCLPVVNIQPFGVCSITNSPCSPVTPAPWTNDIHVELGGVLQPLLTETSTLQCVVGGVIQILEPMQDIVMIASGSATLARSQLSNPTQNAQKYVNSNAIPTSTKKHPLINKGVDKITEDLKSHKKDDFPENYYEDLSRYLFDQALQETNGNYGQAFSMLNNLQDGKLGYELQDKYEEVIGTDSVNGWDKVRHFIFTAHLEYNFVPLSAEAFTYGKEGWDEIEKWFGKDPEGYSEADIKADLGGQAFAQEMRKREKERNEELNGSSEDIIPPIIVVPLL